MGRQTLILGCGYVGEALAKRWKAQGHRVTVTTTRKERVPSLSQIADEVLVLQGKEQDALHEALRSKDWVAVTIAARHTDDYADAYLATAIQLTAALADMGAPRQIVYTSSTSVYGDCGGRIVNEDEAVHPQSAQGDILRQTEQIFMQASDRDHRVCILRLGEIIGPGRQLLDRLRGLGGMALPGDGHQFANLSPLATIVDALDFACERGLQGIFNVCLETHLTRRQLYSAICSENGLPEVRWSGFGGGIHSGNKRVSSQKIVASGFTFRSAE